MSFPMATTKVAPATRTTSRIALKVVIALLALLLVVFLIADAWFFHAAKVALPQLDGSLSVPGLSAPVTVARDVHGVPTIQAQNLDDLFFAQGFVAAQDRLWQMDMTRRYASGDLAAILGPELVKHDKQQRILGMRVMAERGVAVLSTRDRQYLEDYAKGVNAYIAQHQKTLPLEFRLLTYFPRAWTPEDSMLVGLGMYQYLNGYEAETKLLREKVTAKVGPELAADLYVNSSWRDHPPGSESGEIENNGDGNPNENEEQSRSRTSSPAHPVAAREGWGTHIQPGTHDPAAEYEPMIPGSNDWVVSGSHTATGKPLLSNDMHLGHSIPNTWYMAHLICADYDAAGVTLPGMPYVIVGHNRRIAWGFTNVGPDVQDVFVETFNSNGEYQTPQGWMQPEHRKETIRVKGKPEVVVDVVITRHGPIVTDLVPGETRKIAVKWTAADPNAIGLPFFDVNSAGNWQQFLDGFSKFGGPGQNVVYADVDGHIGYHTTGKVPIRASGNGALPVAGNDDAHEWTGYIPFDKLPSGFDPPLGIIGTANGRIAPDGYPYLISNEWTEPYRTQRIYRVLSSKQKLTPADMLALQMDAHSELDKFTAEKLVYAVDQNPKASDRAKKAADLMRGWDGDVNKDSVAPTIETYSRRWIWRKMIQGKGIEPHDYDWMMNAVWFENVLAHQPDRWLPPGYANYNELFAAAVEDTVKRDDAPHALGLWKYGRAFPVEFSHPFWGRLPIIKRSAGTGPTAQSGNAYTVKATAKDFGASERMTVDFSDLDHSTLNIVNGESGNIFSDYFNDQWAAYSGGTTFAWSFSADAVKASTKHQLTLTP
ncbi:Penicillin amidase [Candidatus Koribacter versatilis Ellin345]|uniref:Penicillin amidase n=2 Tax=Candidatus Korobacter versatilis TaxID=658062 RepID=Q1IL79_KORVE|nr:Penicillin amidase [Candidatus Koribacter versatilis Ellin345]